MERLIRRGPRPAASPFFPTSHVPLTLHDRNDFVLSSGRRARQQALRGTSLRLRVDTGKESRGVYRLGSLLRSLPGEALTKLISGKHVFLL